MRVYQKLAVATAGLALSFTTVDVIPAQAAILKYDFTVSIPEIPFLGFVPEVPYPVQPLAGSTGSGFFTYDDAATPVFDPLFGLEFFGVTEVEFNFFGNTFTASDEVGVAGGLQDTVPLPYVLFRDGVFLGLNYLVTSTRSRDIGFVFGALNDPYPSFVAGRGAIGTRNEAGGYGLLSAYGYMEGGEVLSEGNITYSFQGSACH
jgi:hypothetical protein